MPFTSDPSTHRQCFNVTIIDDDVLEDTERFTLRLSLVEGSSVPVIVLPDVSAVEIEDEDCKQQIIMDTWTLMSSPCSYFCWV